MTLTVQEREDRFKVAEKAIDLHRRYGVSVTALAQRFGMTHSNMSKLLSEIKKREKETVS